jgi:hypothetical protein
MVDGPSRSAGHVLEETWLEISGSNSTRRGQQGPDLASTDESSAADLDALELAGPGPVPDRLAAEVDICRGEDIGRLGDRDPVGSRRGHGGQSVEPEPELEPELRDELDGPERSGFGAATALSVAAGVASLSFAGVPPSVEAPSPFASLDVPPSVERAAARELELRSFFAQPLPLKWTDGAVITLVIVPSAPHSGQKLGPSAAIPWTTSVSRWHFEQT